MEILLTECTARFAEHNPKVATTEDLKGLPAWR